MARYWLMKAEPDSRVVKGKDVKFSVDDFAAIGTSPWEGVRNHEAKNLMKSMQVGDNVLFYHSNCKTPGIAAFAQVAKEAYPDYTAWDPDHPYYDPKTDKQDPKWYMVDVKFVAPAQHFVPLALLRYIADDPSPSPPQCLHYIGDAGVKAIKDMPLVRRGRLSVQKVPEEAWQTVQLLAENGGWEELALQKTKTKKPKSVKKKKKSKDEDNDDEQRDETDTEAANTQTVTATQESQSQVLGSKRKAEDLGVPDHSTPLRRSSRARK